MSFDTQKQEILDKLSIVEIVSEYVGLKRKGDKHWGLCPFHNEKTPSFSVTEERSMFYCFGCHKGGNIFDFLMEVENISFYEAFKKCASITGIEIETREDDPEDKNKSAFLELYKRVAGSLNFILKNKESAEPARTFLKLRGIGNETIDSFKLGYAPSQRFWLYNFLKQKNYSDSFLADSGIFTRKNSRISLFSNRLMFPVININQEILAFSGRKLREEDWGGKYVNSPETIIYRKGETIFGLHLAAKEIRKEKIFFLVEGNFDVLAMFEAGIKNVVAPLGTAFTEAQAKLLKRYGQNCIIVFDGDDAGIEATLKSSIILEKIGIAHKVVSLPKGKDPSDILEKEGPEALNNMTKYPINTFKYLVEQAVDRFNVDNPEGKEAVLKFVAPYMSSISTSLRKEESFKFLSEVLNVDVRAVIKDHSDLVYNRTAAKARNSSINTAKLPVSIDLFIMMALVENRSAFTNVRNEISSDDLEDSRAKRLFILMENMFRRDDNSIDSILSDIKDENLKNLLIEKLSTSEYSINSDKIIKDGVIKIKQRKYEKQRREIENLMKKTDVSATGKDELERLLSEKKYIDDELLRIKGN